MTGDLTGIVAIVIFWGFIAACVFIGAWKRKKLETLRHETARLVIEKNSSIDPAVLAQLLNPRDHNHSPKMMKVLGTIVIALGVGMWLMCLWFVFAVGEGEVLGLGGPATLVMAIGAGIFFASRFAPRHPDEETKTETSSIIHKNGSER